MSRTSHANTARIVHRFIFETILKESLMALGATQVTFEGLDVDRKHMRYAFDIRPAEVQAAWADTDPQGRAARRKVAYAIDQMILADVFGTWELDAVKAFARDIARNIIHERLSDTIARVKLTIPLSAL